MPNHGIEFDVQECILKRDAEGRLAIIHFEANTIQLICDEKNKCFNFFHTISSSFSLPSNISESIDSLK